MRVLSILLFSMISLAGMAQSKYLKIAGDWEGSISNQGQSLKVVFHIKWDGENVSATMDSPDQNAFGLKVDEVSFVDGVLKMKSTVVQGNYEGTVNNNKIEGKWRQGAGEFELNLSKKRKKGTS